MLSFLHCQAVNRQSTGSQQAINMPLRLSYFNKDLCIIYHLLENVLVLCMKAWTDAGPMLGYMDLFFCSL